jgi:hypothetical protein
MDETENTPTKEDYLLRFRSALLCFKRLLLMCRSSLLKNRRLKVLKDRRISYIHRR